jgi:hypothetical protein
LEVENFVKTIRNDIDEYLKENYNKVPISDIAKLFKVAESTVYARMGKLGVSNRFQWTKKRVLFLIENYSSGTWKFLFDGLKTNDKMRILGKASELGLRRSGEYSEYTQEEIDFIENNYFTMSLEKIAILLKRTLSGVYTKANKLGLKTRDGWSNEELSLLKKVYPNYTNKEIQKRYFPDREIGCIQVMARKQGVMKSSEKGMKRYNKENMIESLVELAEKLGRTPLGEELVNYGIPSSTSYRRYFGSYYTACEEAGLKTNSSLFGKSVHCYSINGDLCLSAAEKTVTDFFINNNIMYKKEKNYSLYIEDDRCGGKIVDWIIGDNIFVEYFGLSEKPYYQKKMKEKILICKENNIFLMSLFRKDLNKLHLIFSDFI